MDQGEPSRFRDRALFFTSCRRRPTLPSAPTRSIISLSRRRPRRNAGGWRSPSPPRRSFISSFRSDSLAYYAVWPQPRRRPEEIPVEVVVEPPPPKEEKPQDQPKPPPHPEDERPAYDAPSAATQEKANRESPDAKTQAPTAKAQPQQKPGAPQQSETRARGGRAKGPGAAAARGEIDPERRRCGGRDPIAVEADTAPPAAKVEPKPAPPPAPKPPPTTPAGAPLPTDDVLPEYKFAHAATKSPIVGGTADTRYFTIVYGMIRSICARRRDPAPRRRAGAERSSSRSTKAAICSSASW